MSYGDLSGELAGTLPGLSTYLADDYIKRAWRKIRDARVWSFLLQDDALVCPTALNAGAYNITQFNNQVIANAAASAAFAAISPVILPPQFLQLRFMGPATTSQIYNIVTLDPTDPDAYVFTLDRAVMEPTNSASPYLCYRCYITPPSTDFIMYDSLVDMVNGIPITGPRLRYTSRQFDMMDPQRQALGRAVYLGSYKYSTEAVGTATQPLYELWPGPTQGQIFYTRYRRRGLDFSNPNDVQDANIPDDLIMQAALGFYAYPWAQANAGSFPKLTKTNWSMLTQDAKRTYYTILQDAKRQDDNTMLQSVLQRGHGLRSGNPAPMVVDAAFIQSHLLNI